MNTALRTMTVLACLLALGACTTQEAYENIRASERQKCSTLPQTEYERRTTTATTRRSAMK